MKGLTREAAVDQAVEDCIKADILRDFLSLHRAEVKDVILTEYNEKRHEETLIEQGKAEMAIRMLKDGMPPEKVKQYTGLGEEQWHSILRRAGLSQEQDV